MAGHGKGRLLNFHVVQRGARRSGQQTGGGFLVDAVSRVLTSREGRRHV
jgi:hypothetical protein